MIGLTDDQAITVHRLLTCILLNETYQLVATANCEAVRLRIKRWCSRHK
jgi:hypothetical protein